MMQSLDKLFIGATVPDILKNDLQMEQLAHPLLLKGVRGTTPQE